MMDGRQAAAPCSCGMQAGTHRAHTSPPGGKRLQRSGKHAESMPGACPVLLVSARGCCLLLGAQGQAFISCLKAAVRSFLVSILRLTPAPLAVTCGTKALLSGRLCSVRQMRLAYISLAVRTKVPSPEGC